ncbi:MAG: DUF1549 domain-containing protein, partial [Flavobacteriaceae bacterium]|nr:DUF1549 domain-containing protein [Flavobacteriaceae bacterium]
DTLNNLGKSFLGLTIGCARCHNHKFDPIPTRDYYALYGIFDSSVYPHAGAEHQPYRRDFIYRVGLEKADQTLQPYREALAPYSSTPRVSTERLIDAQKKLQRDKNVWIAVTVGIYLLNIIEANVDAHLKQFNVSDKLTIQPNIDINPINHPSNYGLSLTYKFN